MNSLQPVPEELIASLSLNDSSMERSPPRSTPRYYPQVIHRESSKITFATNSLASTHLECRVASQSTPSWSPSAHFLLTQLATCISNRRGPASIQALHSMSNLVMEGATKSLPVSIERLADMKYKISMLYKVEPQHHGRMIELFRLLAALVRDSGATLSLDILNSGIDSKLLGPLLPILKILKVRFLSSVPPDALANLLASCSNLQELDLENPITLKQNDLQLYLSKINSLLTSLTLNRTSWLAPEDLQAIASNFSSLVHFSAAGCLKVTDAAIRSLLSRCPQLGLVDISGTSCSDALLESAEFLHHRHIRRLDLSGCQEFTGRTLVHAAQRHNGLQILANSCSNFEQKYAQLFVLINPTCVLENECAPPTQELPSEEAAIIRLFSLYLSSIFTLASAKNEGSRLSISIDSVEAISPQNECLPDFLRAFLAAYDIELRIPYALISTNFFLEISPFVTKLTIQDAKEHHGNAPHTLARMRTLDCSGTQITVQQLQGLLHPKLEKLYLEKCPALTKTPFLELLANVANLVELNVKGSFKLTLEELHVILTFEPLAKTIRVSLQREGAGPLQNLSQQMLLRLLSIDAVQKNQQIAALLAKQVAITPTNMYEMILQSHAEKIEPLYETAVEAFCQAFKTIVAIDLKNERLAIGFHSCMKLVSFDSLHATLIEAIEVIAGEKEIDVSIELLVEPIQREMAFSFFTAFFSKFGKKIASLSISKGSPKDINDFFKGSAPHLTSLKEITLSKYTLLKGEDLASWLQHWGNLTSLSLVAIDRFATIDLKALQLNLPQLKSLTLSSCKEIQDGAVQYLCDKCPSLTSIDLSQCPITDKALHALSATDRNVTRLSLAGTQVTLKGLELLAKRLPIILHLDLANCSNLGQNARTLISEWWPVLKSLSCCPNITLSDISTLLQNCIQIESIQLAGCGLPSQLQKVLAGPRYEQQALQIDLGQVATAKELECLIIFCTKLRKLAIKNCQLLTTESSKAIFTELATRKSLTNSSTLHSLVLQGTALDSQAAIGLILEASIHLKTLTIAFPLKPSHLHDLLHHLPHLKKLILKCPCNDEIKTLLQKLPTKPQLLHK